MPTLNFFIINNLFGKTFKQSLLHHYTREKKAKIWDCTSSSIELRAKSWKGKEYNAVRIKKRSLFSFVNQFDGIGRSRKSRDCSLFGGCNGSASICKSKYLSQPWLILKIKIPTMLEIVTQELFFITNLNGDGWFIEFTSSTDWSSTILQSSAPTNESPAPVVSTVSTWKASTDPWKFCFAKPTQMENI